MPVRPGEPGHVEAQRKTLKQLAQEQKERRAAAEAVTVPATAEKSIEPEIAPEPAEPVAVEAKPEAPVVEPLSFAPAPEAAAAVAAGQERQGMFIIRQLLAKRRGRRKRRCLRRLPRSQQAYGDPAHVDAEVSVCRKRKKGETPDERFRGSLRLRQNELAVGVERGLRSLVLKNSSDESILSSSNNSAIVILRSIDVCRWAHWPGAACPAAAGAKGKAARGRGYDREVPRHHGKSSG